MQHNFLQFDLSPWLILIGIFIAVGGSYMLYAKDTNWGKALHYALITLRFICLFFLSLLLLGPVLNQVKNTIEKPIWVIAIDNSSSIPQVLDSTQIAEVLNKAKSLQNELEDNDYLVELRTFDAKVDEVESIKFDKSFTNINTTIKEVNTDYEGRNLAGLVLVSDGIYNRGMSPLFGQYGFPIHTIGIGDTLEKQDLYIEELKFNKISYEGNIFPIAVTLGNKGYSGIALLSLANNNKVISSKRIELSENQPIHQTQFQVEASASGLQKYSIHITNQTNEDNTANNTKSAYIDIIEGKERILLVASAPHPDIKAISNSINKKNNYELKTYIPNLGQNMPDGKFDLIIYHGLPDRSLLYKQISTSAILLDIPYLIISGAVNDIRRLNVAVDYFRIQKLGNDNDKVTASINPAFSNFTLSENLSNLLPGLPPLEVPYANIEVNEGSSTLLYQRLGNVVMENPMLQINATNDKRSAVFIGEGLWRWKLHEFNLKGNTDGFDELTLKLVQYLSTKIDKRKFKCSPIKNEVVINEGITFETEIYNDLYDLVFDQEIDLSLTNENDESFTYNFVNAKGNNRYKINGLKNGIYQYIASTNLDGVVQTVSGELVISEQQIESLNTTADFHLLAQVAQKNNGEFYLAEDFPIKDHLELEQSKGIIHSAETFDSLINFEWLFILLISLLSIEWLSRKYNGAY